MAVKYAKKAAKTPATGESETRARVAEMLAAIEAGGEDVARRYGADLDGYKGEIVVSKETIEKDLPPTLVTEAPGRERRAEAGG